MGIAQLQIEARDLLKNVWPLTIPLQPLLLEASDTNLTLRRKIVSQERLELSILSAVDLKPTVYANSTTDP